MAKLGYRTCRVCKKYRNLKKWFYKRKRKNGNWTYESTCKSCVTNQFLQRYGKAKELLKEMVSIEYPADYLQEQECGKCIFLVECNYMVKVQKSLKNPYCFTDSPLHHRFLKQYGKELR
jgi:hypothetical protein